MFEPADNPNINSLHAPSDQGFYALIIGDILTESRKYLHLLLPIAHSFIFFVELIHLLSKLTSSPVSLMFICRR